MGDCRCLDAVLTISGDVHSAVAIDGDVHATAGVGTVVIRDGTNDYNQLVHKPSIEGKTLEGDSTLPQIGVGLITEQDIDTIIFG